MIQIPKLTATPLGEDMAVCQTPAEERICQYKDIFLDVWHNKEFGKKPFSKLTVYTWVDVVDDLT